MTGKQLLLVFGMFLSGAAFAAECTLYEKSHPRYVLSGAHLSTGKCTNCGTCHINGVWIGTPNTCIACHNGDPARTTVYRSAAHLPTLSLDCAGCHITTTFQSGITQTKTHNTSISSIACKTCHSGAYASVYNAMGKPRDHPTSYTKNGVTVLVASVDCGYCHSYTKTDFGL
jgi:hypothetical protein